MIKKIFVFILLCLTTLGCTSSFAVVTGESAPPITLGKFLKGEPVSFAKDQQPDLTVLAFWATWCPACKNAFPLLSELSEEFEDKGVVFIGISDEDQATVSDFLKTDGDSLSFRIALDPSGLTSSRYDISGIPQVVIVDRSGLIVWQGHPSEGLDMILADLTTGGYDPSKVTAIVEKAQMAERVEKIIPLYLYVLAEVDDPELLAFLENKIYKYIENDLMQLKDLAWSIVSKHLETEGVSPVENGTRFILRANELAGGKDADVLDTSAAIFFLSDKFAEAVVYAEQAVKLSDNPEEQQQYRNRLTVYNSSYQKTKIPFRWFISRENEKLVVEVEIQNDFYLYEGKTAITLLDKNGQTISGVNKPLATKKEGEEKGIYIGGKAHRWELALTSPLQPVAIQIEYQGCDDKNNICFYPETLKKDIPVVPSSVATPSDDELVKVYLGKRAPVSIASHPKAKAVEAELLDAQSIDCNFAGNKTLLLFKTNNGLVDLAVIDAHSGNVYFLPFSVKSVKFRADSKVLKAINGDMEEVFMVWGNDEFNLL